MRLRTALLSALVSFLPAVASASEGEKLVGTKAKEWDVTDWINSDPLTLKGQAGKVVLVRWWTGPGCAVCAATAPALNEFHAAYKDKGLVVVGFYHHKAQTPLKLDTVKHA